MNVKFIKIWICFVIIFLSFVNGNHQPPGRTIVKIEEDPLVDKITKINHNLKLVKLKKVKKVYSNGDELNQPVDDQISKKPTIVDLNTKNNIATQTPISFLILDKPIKNDHQNDLKNNNDNLIGNKLLDELIREHHKLPNDLITNKLPDNLKEKTDSSNDDSNIINGNENLSSNIKLNKELDKNNKNEINDKNDKNDRNDLNDKNDKKNQRNKSIKKLFPSVNKFKQLNLNKPALPSFSKATSANPFASSSNKSTFKTEFLNKVTTKKSNYTSTTIKPMINQTKKLINPKSKPDRFKAFTTTTIEPPRTYATYKPNKKTTTFTPYIYSTTTSSTIEPIFRIRNNKQTTIRQTSQPTTDQTIRTTTSQTNKPIAITLKNNKFNYKNEFKSETTKSPNTDKSDLETHNSSRKYAKLFLNNRKSNDQVTTSTFMKYTTKFYTTTTPLPIEISTTSYLRTNSRITTFTSYLPYSTDFTTTTIIPEFTKSQDLNTENSIKNEIDKDKILTASRRRPIIRPRRVKPNQLEKLNITPLPKLELTTEIPILTTTYSPKFRSTTIYPLRFRSTTQTSSTKYLNQFRTSTSNPITIRNDEVKHKEFKLYSNLDRNYKTTDLPIKNESPIKLSTDFPIRSTTELPATSRFYNEKNDLYSKHDLDYNLIPRKSKWILKDEKGTRHKKSDSSYAYNMNDYTQPIRTTTISTIEQTTISKPISYVTTNSIELKNKFNEISDNKIIDRAPKSVDTFYQMRRPQPFLINNQNRDEQQASILKNLKYEEPKRNTDTNTENSLDPDKEIYYKDTKIRKESKLVPQTYFYPTNAPSLNELNEKLSYLNEAKSKYQRPYLNDKKLENKKYEKPINLENELNEDDPKFRYPNLPNNIPYHIPNKYPIINNNDNDRKNYLKNDNRLPYIKTHFNLGHQSNNSPKYGSVLNQVSNQVGKLSKPFSNQSPLPFFQPIKPDNQNSIEQNQPELLRFKIKDEKEYENDKNVHRVVDLRPFDFKNYQPLPNAKFIRTDLDSERLAKNSPIDHEKPIDNYHYSNPPIIENEKYKPTKITSYEPVNVYPYNKDYRTNEIGHNKIMDFNKHEEKDNTHYIPKDFTNYNKPININYNKLIDHDKEVADYRPIGHKPINYSPYPIDNPYNKPIENTQPQTNIQPTYNTHLDYLNKLNIPSSTEYSNLNSNDKNVKFNLNRIPAKVVYDRYNQKFSGPISLKPSKYPPTSKHYAEIPKSMSPIEYQRKPLLPIINPMIEKYKTTTYNDYNNYQDNESPINKPNYDKFNRDKSYKSIYDEFNRDKSYKPNYDEFNRDKSYKPNYDEFNRDKSFKPIYDENSVYKHPIRLPNYPINNYRTPNKILNPISKDEKYNQIYNHANNYIPNNQNNVRFNNLNNYKEFERDYRSPPSSPVHYNQNKPIYYNQFINHQQTLNNNPNSQFREENNNLINRNQDNNQYNNQDNNQYNNQFNNQYNAGHYDNRIYLKPTKDVELINLSDITPNLSLFKDRIPNFQLLQNTVISHDIPVVKNYNLKSK